jgi:hypothetical protein
MPLSAAAICILDFVMLVESPGEEYRLGCCFGVMNYFEEITVTFWAVGPSNKLTGMNRTASPTVMIVPRFIFCRFTM